MSANTIPFLKAHGAGNDFIIIVQTGGIIWKSPSATTPAGLLPASSQDRETPIELTGALAKSICDRHFGIGADQILWLRPAKSPQAQARMEIFNEDGSRSEMCGNGLRAVGMFLDRYAEVNGPLIIETQAGLHQTKIHSQNPYQVEIEMGQPEFETSKDSPREIISVDLNKLEQEFNYRKLSFGNPHVVIEVEDLETFDAAIWGPALETHQKFMPQKANIGFYQKMAGNQIRLRVWERGAGLTLACGSGACAAAAASMADYPELAPSCRVQLPGGTLDINWDPNGSQPLTMKGPAQEVFWGRYPIFPPTHTYSSQEY